MKSLRAYIARECGSSFAINLAINGGLAWLLFRHKDSLPLWEPNGFGQDMLITALLLWLLLSAIVIGIHRRKARAGKLPVLNDSDFTRLRSALRWLPRGTWAASMCLAVVGVVICALPLLAMFHLLDISAMSPLQYSIFKGFWAGAMAVVATPIAILFPLHAPSLASSPLAAP